jgi:hypothetical protein
MRKLFINFFLAGAFLMTLPSAWGFSNAGPIANGDDQWQTAALGYGLPNFEAVAPKDIFEEYRPVVPVMYYACDATFLTYYGYTGLTNIDGAFGILNGFMCGLTNTPVFLYSPTNGVTLAGNGLPGGVPITISPSNTVDAYSANLSEIPLENQQVNYTAQALSLMDIKSFVLHQVVSELGLADSTRYVWTLHDRLADPDVKAPTCPANEVYLVVQRNFDVNPTQNYPYSSYINGSLYLFDIEENCGNNPNVAYTARTFCSPADRLDAFPPITQDGLLIEYEENQFGAYFTSLTRDDGAGFKYLLSTNNLNWESTAASGGTLIATNIGGLTILITSDLGSLIAASLTNDPVALATQFPGLVDYGLATNYSIGFITNSTTYYTNPIGEPYGSPPQLVTVTTLTPTIITNYLTAFGNVVINHYYTNSYGTVQTTAVTNRIGAPYGSPLYTNVTYQPVVFTNIPSGDYYLITSNLWGYKIDSVGLTNRVIYTNIVISATNTTTTTTTNSTSTNAYSVTQQILIYKTNYWLYVQPLYQSFPSNAPALREGIGRVQFIRANFDSLLGQLFQPLTNYYTMVKVFNSQPVTEYYQRVVTAPDFLFQSADLTVPAPPNLPYGADASTTVPVFDTSAIQGNLAGPGTIKQVPQVIVFNKNENLLYLSTSQAQNTGSNVGTNSTVNSSDITQLQGWGSFDGSTNYPVYYPSTTSIANLMNQVVVPVTPAVVPDGTNNVPYSVTFSATGGTPPYAWSAPGFAVPGLAFNPTTVTVSGTPTVSATFSFTLQLTDSANRVISLNYPITFH